VDECGAVQWCSVIWLAVSEGSWDLSHDQVTAAYVLSIPDSPARLLEQILERSRILYWKKPCVLMDQVRSEDGHWRFVPGVDTTNLGVPDTLQELILARFDRLVSSEKHVLQVASVIGKNFALPVLGTVLREIDPITLRSTLDSLVDREFILPQVDTLETEYTFRHILMSDAIYGTILRKERSRWHGEVGEVIETLYAEQLDEQIELLASHYRWSPKLDRALHYLILAGQKAARTNLHEQARGKNCPCCQNVSHQPYQAFQVRTV
jgi:hypothetical protein